MLSLYFADSTAAGRINTDMLTDQQVMELFFTPDSYKDARAILRGDENDACSWSGIKCDDNGHIKCLDWDHRKYVLQGSLNFPMFPRNMRLFDISGQRLVGAVDLCHLPEALNYFRIHACGVTGTLDIEKLPRNLQYLFVTENAISDVFNVRNLPKNMQELTVNEHGIHKEVLFIEKLPNSYTRLNFQNCDIEHFRFADPADAQKLFPGTYSFIDIDAFEQ